MSLAEIPLLITLLALAAYTVLGGADFGAGFWHMALAGPKRAELRDHTYKAMAPVWEANHVWLVFLLPVAWTAYPQAFASIASTLYIPLFIAAIGYILRGTAYAMRGSARTPVEQRLLGVVFGVSSLLTPFALGAAVGAIASGRVPVGNAAGEPFGSWLNPTSILVGVIAVVTSVYLAAVWLTADAARGGREDIVATFRRLALATGAVAGALSLAGLIVLRGDARNIYDGLITWPGIAAVIASALAGAVAMLLVARSRFEPARYASAVAVAAITAGWALAQQPDLLPGLTVEEAAASDATLVALLVAVGAGSVILIPSLALLFGLVLRGRFDEAPQERGNFPDVATGRTEADPGPLPDDPRRLFGAAGVAGIGALLLLITGAGIGRIGGVVLLLIGCAAVLATLLPQIASIGDD